MKAPGPLTKLLVWLLVVVLAAPQASIVAYAAEHPHPQPTDSSNPVPETEWPLIEMLEKLGKISKAPDFQRADEWADADPFFLRGQHWADRKVSSPNKIAEAGAPDSLTIADATTQRDLVIAGDWHTIGATDRWIFLSPSASSFFERLGSSDAWSGFFAIDRNELAASEQTNLPVPIYFLPTPNQTWTGVPRAVEIEEYEAIFLTDGSTDPFLIDLADIATLVQAERLNLFVAISEAAQTVQERTSYPLPLPGSTLGFGLSVHPRTLDKTQLPAPKIIDGSEGSFLQRAFDSVLGIPTAYAEDSKPKEEGNSNVISVVIRVGAVMSVALAAAFVAKIVWRDELKKRRIERGQVGSLSQHAKELGNLYASNLAILNYTDKLGFAYGLRFFMDRYLTGMVGSKSRIARGIRWILDESVFWYARGVEHVPVDWRTLLFGVFALGGIESVTFGILCFWAFPQILSFIGAPQIATTGSDYVRNEWPRNVASWAFGGAPYFSGEQRLQAMLVVEPRVESEMRARQLDLHDPRNEAERKRLFDLYMQETLEKMNLPQDKDVLYDFTRLWSESMDLLGYSLPKGFVPNQPVDKYLGLIRPGVISPAARATTQRLKERLSDTPHDETLVAAVRLAEEVEADIHWLSGVVFNRDRWMRTAKTVRGPPLKEEWTLRLRRTRQHLVAITGNGPLNQRLKSIPSEWVQTAGRRGANLFAIEYRKAFLSIVEEEPEILNGISATLFPWLEESHQTQAEQTAESELIRLYKHDWDRFHKTFGQNKDLAKAAFLEHHAAQRQIFIEDRLVALAKAQKVKSTPYEAPRTSRFREYQKQRSLRLANRAIAQEAEVTEELRRDPSDERYRSYFMRQVRESMMKVVGLSPDYAAIPGLEKSIHDLAWDLTQSELTNRKFVDYLSTLDPESRLDAEALVYAEKAVKAYVQLTVNSTSVDPLSTARPDRFSWIRQKESVRKNIKSTRFWRFMGSFFPSEAHDLGLRNQLYRTIPGLYDAKSGIERTLRVFPTTAGPTYLYNWALLDIRMSYPVFLMSMAFYFTYKGPEQWLTRVFTHQGVRPMGSVSRMLAFAVCYSLVTSWGSPFIMALEGPTQEFAASLPSKVAALPETIKATASTACQLLLEKLGL